MAIAIVACTSILSACDESDDSFEQSGAGAGADQWRAGYVVVYKKSTTKTFSARGTDNPITGDGVGPVPGPLHPRDIELLVRNYDAVFSAAFEGSRDAEAICPETCGARDLRWTGVTDVRGDYDVSEPYRVEGEDGRVFEEVEVYANLAYGCGCAEVSDRPRTSPFRGEAGS